MINHAELGRFQLLTLASQLEECKEQLGAQNKYRALQLLLTEASDLHALAEYLSRTEDQNEAINVRYLTQLSHILRFAQAVEILSWIMNAIETAAKTRKLQHDHQTHNAKLQVIANKIYDKQRQLEQKTGEWPQRYGSQLQSLLDSNRRFTSSLYREAVTLFTEVLQEENNDSKRQAPFSDSLKAAWILFCEEQSPLSSKQITELTSKYQLETSIKNALLGLSRSMTPASRFFHKFFSRMLEELFDLSSPQNAETVTMWRELGRNRDTYDTFVRAFLIFLARKSLDLNEFELDIPDLTYLLEEMYADSNEELFQDLANQFRNINEVVGSTFTSLSQLFVFSAEHFNSLFADLENQDSDYNPSQNLALTLKTARTTFGNRYLNILKESPEAGYFKEILDCLNADHFDLVATIDTVDSTLKCRVVTYQTSSNNQDMPDSATVATFQVDLTNGEIQASIDDVENISPSARNSIHTICRYLLIEMSEVTDNTIQERQQKASSHQTANRHHTKRTQRKVRPNQPTGQAPKANSHAIELSIAPRAERSFWPHELLLSKSVLNNNIVQAFTNDFNNGSFNSTPANTGRLQMGKAQVIWRYKSGNMRYLAVDVGNRVAVVFKASPRDSVYDNQTAIEAQAQMAYDEYHSNQQTQPMD